MRRLAALALVLATAVTTSVSTPAGAAGGQADGPRMSSGSAGRQDAVTCTGDLRRGPVPVLLVPGTAVSAVENWSTSYQPALLAEGRAVCLVALPDYALGDLQRSIEYVATAIRVVQTRAHRRIAVIGHSQGALLPRIALKVWPDLARRVDDVIGLAGVYDRGSEGLTQRCQRACVTAMHQMRHGARLLRATAQRRLPTGPSYTNIGTRGDQAVTPQPAANRQAGATAIEVQDVCRGRRIPVNEHGYIIGDAVAKALVDDALSHRGAARAGRVPRSTCELVYYPGFVPTPLLTVAPFVRGRLTGKVRHEPALRCHLRRSCADVDARGRLLEDRRRSVGSSTVTWRAQVPLDGLVKITFRGRSAVHRVRPGSLTLRVRRPRGSGVLVLETLPDRYSAWAREDALRLR